MKHLTRFALLLLSVALLFLFGPIGIAYTLLLCVFRMAPNKAVGYLSNTALLTAIANDMLGNVLCRDLCNALLITHKGYAFGKPGDTISYVLGRNKAPGTLSLAGRALADLLNWIDPDHVEKAIL